MPIRISGMNSGLDTDAIVKELVSAYNKKTETFQKQKTKLEWKQDAWKDLNTKIYNFYSGPLTKMRMVGAYRKKTTVSSDPSKATVTASGDAVMGVQKLKVKSIAQTAYLTGSKIEAGEGVEKIKRDTKLSELGLSDGITMSLEKGQGSSKTSEELSLGADATIADVVNAFKEKGLNASFDENNQRFFISAKESGAANDFNIKGDKLSILGLEADPDEDDSNNASFAQKVTGLDAKIELNGAEFTSNTNSFSINGLNINVIEETGDKAINLTTNTDTQGIYDSIKEFLKEYNKLVNEMDKLFNAASSKGYEPLTDEEKEEMSDKEVEKWETKIKDSLLRRDQTLSSVTSVLKNAMAKTYEVNGEKLSLASFGISTGSYFTAAENEKGAYHIDGDKDDSSTNSKTDKLMKAITENPDQVADFFSQLVKGTFDALDSKMKSTTLSSVYKVYNDKQMASDVTALDKRIKTWEDKVKDMEDAYFKKFTAMEKALAELQSSQNALGGLFGGQ